MAPADDWAAVLAAAQDHQAGRDRFGRSESGRTEFVAAAMDLCVVAVPGTVACSVSQQQDDGAFVTSAADRGEVALELDEVQYEAGEGPCLTATRIGAAQRIDDMAQDVRWPRFGALAAGRGVGSSLSIPLRTAAQPGAVNFYGSTSGLFREARTALVAQFVARVSDVLLAAPRSSTALSGDGAAAGADRMHDERSTIARAQLLVMKQYPISPAMAFRHLAVRSQEEGMSMIDIARGIVELATRRELPGP